MSTNIRALLFFISKFLLLSALPKGPLMRDYTQYDDMQLLSLVKQSDKAAYTEIYDRYWKKLLYKAGKKIYDLSEAENMAQDIFMDIWKRRNELEVTGTFSHYLSVALKYRVINFHNRVSKRSPLQDPNTAHDSFMDHTTEEYLAHSDLYRRMAKIVAALPEKCQLAFLRREAGLSHKEIANEMGISENTVNMHVNRALKSLRNGLTHIFFFLY